ncbi:hypothetical protein ACFLSG_00005, partial [Candidatus Bipolaricaulota bacterium]
EEAAIFECTCQQALRREPEDRHAVCTNHATLPSSAVPNARSLKRYQRLEELVRAQDWTNLNLPDGLIRILADDEVERRDADFGTVYSVVVCPGTRMLWTTLSGYPAASQGNWQQIHWPL